MGKDWLHVDLLKDIGKIRIKMQKQGERNRKDTNTVVQEQQTHGTKKLDKQAETERLIPSKKHQQDYHDLLDLSATALPCIHTDTHTQTHTHTHTHTILSGMYFHHQIWSVPLSASQHSLNRDNPGGKVLAHTHTHTHSDTFSQQNTKPFDHSTHIHEHTHTHTGWACCDQAR